MLVKTETFCVYKGVDDEWNYRMMYNVFSV